MEVIEEIENVKLEYIIFPVVDFNDEVLNLKYKNE